MRRYVLLGAIVIFMCSYFLIVIKKDIYMCRNCLSTTAVTEIDLLWWLAGEHQWGRIRISSQKEANKYSKFIGKDCQCNKADLIYLTGVIEGIFGERRGEVFSRSVGRFPVLATKGEPDKVYEFLVSKEKTEPNIKKRIIENAINPTSDDNMRWRTNLQKEYDRYVETTIK